MADFPILFSSLMVQALWKGQKTQTRRIHHIQKQYKMQAGDRLWVREAWAAPASFDRLSPSTIVQKCLATGYHRAWCPIYWPATADRSNWDDTFGSVLGRRRASMHLPRPFSRITLIVKSINVEPLQDISVSDALAEGIPEGTSAPVEEYRRLWDSLNKDRGYGWNDNPLVNVITFHVRKLNIDALERD